MQGWSWIPNFGISIARPLPVSEHHLSALAFAEVHVTLPAQHETVENRGLLSCESEIEQLTPSTVLIPSWKYYLLQFKLNTASQPFLLSLSSALTVSMYKSFCCKLRCCVRTQCLHPQQKGKVSLQRLPLMRDSRNIGPVAMFESCCFFYFY